MILGNSDAGATTTTLTTDTRYLYRVSSAEDLILDKLGAYMDGSGAAVGDQVVRAVAYDSAGALVASGAPVTIPEGAPAGWVDLPLDDPSFIAAPQLLAGAKYDLGLLAGPTSGSARLYGFAERTNLIKNPSFEVNLTDWSTAVASATINDFTRSTVWSYSGVASAHFKATATAGSALALATPTAPAVVAGTTYAIEVRLNIITSPVSKPHIVVAWYAGASYLSNSEAVLAAGVGEQTLTLVTTAPATATLAAIYIGHSVYVMANAEVSEFYLDALQVVVEAGPGAYFDGSTAAPSGVVAGWAGTAHDSASYSGIKASAADTYSDGPAATISAPTFAVGSHSLFAEAAVPYVVSTELTEEEIARFGFATGQTALATGVSQDKKIARYAEVGWHGTALDPDFGAFALVREDGVCGDLIGERVRVVAPDKRSVIAYVKNFSEIDEDLTLSRGCYLRVGNLSDEEIRAHVEVLV